MRGPNYIENCLTLTDAYKHYKGTLDENTYKRICKQFNKKVIEYIVVDSGIFYIPFRLGSIHIKKRWLDVSKKIPINWKLTKKYGKVIYYLNDHTDGFIMRFFWDKYRAVVKNRTLYSFWPTRTNKRYLAKAIKEGLSTGYPE